MIFVSYIHVLTAAFLMGLAAAAPLGPVNMMAIRRGVAGGWRHTLACGIGAVFGDLVLFSITLLGGRYLLPDLSNPKLQFSLLAIGAVILFPVGIYFLALAIRDPNRAYKSARRRWNEGSIPTRLTAEAVKSAAFTIFNPLTMLYWVAVTSSWLPFAYSVLGYRAPAWGIMMAGAGLMIWFTALIFFVRFIPHHIGATFFRLANAILGLILIGFAAYCAVILFRHLFR
ncbi:MAG TPA: LysE family transporter [Terracidiphilus sp.]|jgi:threonine/homoserine/homoserine lactone efflux protein